MYLYGFKQIIAFSMFSLFLSILLILIHFKIRIYPENLTLNKINDYKIKSLKFNSTYIIFGPTITLHKNNHNQFYHQNDDTTFYNKLNKLHKFINKEVHIL